MNTQTPGFETLAQPDSSRCCNDLPKSRWTVTLDCENKTKMSEMLSRRHIVPPLIILLHRPASDGDQNHNGTRSVNANYGLDFIDGEEMMSLTL